MDSLFARDLPKILLYILFVVFFTPGLAAGDGLTLADIPVPPNGRLHESRLEGPENLVAEYRILLPEGVRLFEITDHGLNTAKQFVEMIQKRDWTIQQENWQKRGGEFTFKKDIVKELKVSIGPSARPVKGKMRGYIFLKFRLTNLVPLEDVVGIDPPDVPRYPGSVRVKWMLLLGDFSEKYLVVSSETQVKDFFKKELPRHGWQPAPGAGTLRFVKTAASTQKGLPTTLNLFIKEKAGIVEIGVGRSVGTADREMLTDLTLTPVRPETQQGDQPSTVIDISKDIPVFSGLTLKQQRALPVTTGGEEIVKLFYEKEAPMSEVLKMAAFYLEQMQKRGFILSDEQWHRLNRKFHFKKGLVQVKIIIKAIGSYPIPEKDPDIFIPVEITVIFPVPRREIAGEDIKGIPRFPGSVRFYTLQAGIDHIVKYKAVAGVKETEWFFIDKLPAAGWRFAGNDATGLLFVPGTTPGNPGHAFSTGKLIPTTLKIKVDDRYDGTVKIGMDRTRGDT